MPLLYMHKLIDKYSLLISININKMYKKFKFEKEVGIAIKSKETSSQLELVRNNYVCSYKIHQPVTISSTI